MINNNRSHLLLLATTIAVLGIVVITASAMTITTVYAQSATTQEYSSPENNLRFEYPTGWVIEDFSQYPESVIASAERELGYRGIATLCSEDIAIPALGVGYDCQAARTPEAEPESAVYIFQFTDLDRKIALQFGQGTNIENVTTDDAFAFYIQEIIAPDNEDTPLDDSSVVEEIVSKTSGTVPIIDSQSNLVIGQAESMTVEYVYGSSVYGELFVPDIRGYQFFTILDNTAIVVGMEGEADEFDSEEIPEVMQAVIDSFTFVV